MKFDSPIEIAKRPSKYIVAVRDMSMSGVSFYSNHSFEPGMKVDLIIDAGPAITDAEVVRLENNADTSVNDSDYIIALCFNKDMACCKSGVSWLNQFPLKPVGDKIKERRKNERRTINLFARARETSPKIKSKRFKLNHKGLHCVIDQYIPVFHEIKVNFGKSGKKECCGFSGVVIRCEKTNDLEFDLDIFFPLPDRSKIQEILPECL